MNEIQRGIAGMGGASSVEQVLGRVEEKAEERLAKQVDSKAKMQEENEEMTPNVQLKRAETSLKSRAVKKKEKAAGEPKEKIMPIAELSKNAEQFKQNHPDHNIRTLVQIRQLIQRFNSPEQILTTIRTFYGNDPVLAAEVFDFLIQTTVELPEGDPSKGTPEDLRQLVLDAQQMFMKAHGREIQETKALTGAALKAAGKEMEGKGTKILREIYHDSLDQLKDAHTQFDQLSARYTWNDMEKVVNYLLHNIGDDLKKEGVGIPRGKIYALTRQAKALQAILTVYRYQKYRFVSTVGMLKQKKIPIPKQFTFEAMAKQFMGLAKERTGILPEKVLQVPSKLGIENLEGKSIVLRVLLDTIGQVPPLEIYRNNDHKESLFKSIVVALDDLEEQIEEVQSRAEEEGQIQVEDEHPPRAG